MTDNGCACNNVNDGAKKSPAKKFVAAAAPKKSVPKKSVAAAPKKSPTKKSKDCIKSNAKKYIHRVSPPFPAQNCRYRTMIGNDNKLWKSESNKNNIFRWKRLS